jgi:large subunit ribosomal protein L30
MTYAVIRVRGRVHTSKEIKDTLKMMRLNRVNHCVIIPKTKPYQGMLQKAKDYITWGEIDTNTLAKLIVRKGRLLGDEKISDAYIKSNTKYTSILSFSKAVMENEINYSDLKNVKALFRLGPPKKGYEGIKNPYSTGGALGYRGEAINDLINRMLMEGVDAKKQ